MAQSKVEVLQRKFEVLRRENRSLDATNRELAAAGNATRSARLSSPELDASSRVRQPSTTDAATSSTDVATSSLLTRPVSPHRLARARPPASSKGSASDAASPASPPEPAEVEISPPPSAISRQETADACPPTPRSEPLPPANAPAAKDAGGTAAPEPAPMAKRRSWQKLRPLLLRLRAANAFQLAASHAHARRYAVDELDLERSAAIKPTTFGAAHAWQAVLPRLLASGQIPPGGLTGRRSASAGSRDLDLAPSPAVEAATAGPAPTAEAGVRPPSLELAEACPGSEGARPERVEDAETAAARQAALPVVAGTFVRCESLASIATESVPVPVVVASAIETAHGELLRAQRTADKDALATATSVAVARVAVKRAIVTPGGAVHLDTSDARAPVPPEALELVDLLEAVGPPTLLRSASPPVQPAAALEECERARWAGVQAVWAEVKEAGAAAAARAAPWAEETLAAVESVVSPNAAPLVAHLNGMAEEQLAVAAREMRGPSSVHSILSAALDDVQRQARARSAPCVRPGSNRPPRYATLRLVAAS